MPSTVDPCGRWLTMLTTITCIPSCASFVARFIQTPLDRYMRRLRSTRIPQMRIDTPGILHTDCYQQRSDTSPSSKRWSDGEQSKRTPSKPTCPCRCSTHAIRGMASLRPPSCLRLIPKIGNGSASSSWKSAGDLVPSSSFVVQKMRSIAEHKRISQGICAATVAFRCA